MAKTEYTPRGIRNEKLLNAFTDGRYKALLETVTADNELTIQIRADYVNVYYRGCNIARIKSPNGYVEFDKYYFLREDMIPEIPQIKGKHKINVSGDKDRGIPRRDDIINELKDSRDKLKKIFKEEKYEEYFCEAKQVMDGWLGWNEKAEKEEQQQIVYRNTQDDADFYVLDIEYQISTLAPFSYRKSDACDTQTSPRPDIIAVDKAGQLYVIELKKGFDACFKKAGLRAHKQAYDNSIGRASEEFVREFINILEQKQAFGIAPEQLFIDKIKAPIFIFAYATDLKKPNHTMAKFERLCSSEGVGSIGILECRSDHKLVKYK